ncbi:hypothetical protein FKM82_022641 [Ascaphus truei]
MVAAPVPQPLGPTLAEGSEEPGEVSQDQLQPQTDLLFPLTLPHSPDNDMTGGWPELGAQFREAVKTDPILAGVRLRASESQAGEGTERCLWYKGLLYREEGNPGIEEGLTVSDS